MHIGLFDSGVGGLTVLKELMKQIPEASYTYLGDTARLPYGNKAPQTLEKYTQENIEFLDKQGVDAIVIACHSASSVSLDFKSSKAGTPIFNVIAPSCEQAKRSSPKGAIGVIATKATVRSQVYSRYISHLSPNLKVTSQECPLLVPLVEEGLADDEITLSVLNRYLKPLLDQGIDTLILGCTHYPILKNQIAKICGESVSLIDPAQSVARELKKTGTEASPHPHLTIYLTDHAPHFIEHAQSLLGELSCSQILYPSDVV